MDIETLNKQNTATSLKSNGQPAQAAHYINQPSSVQTDTTTGNSTLDDETIIELWKVEMDTIQRAIRLCNDNVPLAAAKLGISPSTIYRKRQSWKAEGKI